jgi:hypothetical protein
MPSRCADQQVAPRLGQQALGRIQQDHRRVRGGAPVTMLRVYCSWPGVSAMMNLRRAQVAK